MYVVKKINVTIMMITDRALLIIIRITGRHLKRHACWAATGADGSTPRWTHESLRTRIDHTTIFLPKHLLLLLLLLLLHHTEHDSHPGTLAVTLCRIAKAVSYLPERLRNICARFISYSPDFASVVCLLAREGSDRGRE